MAGLTCRCGEPLDVPAGGADRVVCPKCGARVRLIRRKGPAPVPDPDGFLRFYCPCGRRLKLDASNERPTHGRCHDCGRVIATAEARTTSPADDAETPTEEMAAVDAARIDAWSRRHLERASASPPMADVKPPSTAEMSPTAAARRGEAGLRTCPRCGKPLHLGTSSCRACGIVVPNR